MIDPVFQSGTMFMAQKLLDEAALRQEAIAANIANAETPGYKRVDVSSDFEARLKSLMSSGQPAAAAERLQPVLAEDASARSIRPDGNSVEIDKELVAMNKNAVNYNYLTAVVSNNIKCLKIAISGQAS